MSDKSINERRDRASLFISNTVIIILFMLAAWKIIELLSMVRRLIK